MTIAAVVVAGLIALAVGLLALRWLVRRHRRIRRLDRAAAGVSMAIAEGRLAAATGEILLQQIDGLRRACSLGREG